MIIASLSLLVVSLHALYTINVAVSQASNSTSKVENTKILVDSEDFRESMSSLEATGVTIQGQSIDEVLSDLEYATESLSEVKKLSNTLEDTQKTYQWTIVVGILGLTTGLTSIYI